MTDCRLGVWRSRCFIILACGLVIALHVTTLLLPLNNPGSSRHTTVFLVKSVDAGLEMITQFMRTGRPFAWPALLDYFVPAICELCYLLTIGAAIFLRRYLWVAAATLAIDLGLLTTFLAYVVHRQMVISSPVEILSAYRDLLGMGFVCWYGTFLLAPVVLLAAMWLQNKERSRAIDLTDDSAESAPDNPNKH